jgi:UDP-2,4-diacetamido-2,4,6-trideoxy-beta-L-altropyranose hydrolase
LMVNSDLVIGAAGGTAWERCCLGIPSLITATASNQRLGAQALAGQFASKLFETCDELASLLREVLSIEHGPQLLKQMGQSASAITTGVGASLVAQELRRIYA